jgi:hypothetical protein
VHPILGISFSTDKIRFTELTSDTSVPRLDHAETIEIDFDFEKDLSHYKSNQKILTNISNEIKNYLLKRNKTFGKISVAISTSQAFLVILPIDFTDGSESFNTKIYWELSNYFPENYNDYVINTYRLNSFMPYTLSDEYLIISVHKNTIEFVKRVFKMINTELTLIDIEHFAAETALRNSYPEKMDSSGLLLIGLKKGRSDYGYLFDSKYRHFSYSDCVKDPEFNLNLVKKVSSLKSTGFADKLNYFFLYGEEIHPGTIEALKRDNEQEIILLDPFVNLNAHTELLKNSELRKVSYQYASSCGVALRSLKQKRDKQ